MKGVLDILDDEMLKAFSFPCGHILVMTVCECIWRSSIDIIWPFLPLYVLELGGSYETISLIMTVGNLANMILSEALMVVGILFILLVDEPEKAEL